MPTSGIVEKLRVYKDAEEIALLTEAIRIADEVIDEISPRIEPGVTEEAVAWELEKAMRERGAEMISFDTIVGAGPNGALPHHRADETVIKPNDAIVIDMGAKYQGYCSDLTRTVFVGEPDEKFRKIYGIVLEAQLAAEEQVRSGMTGKEVDAIARDIIAEAGHGDDFGHSLGTWRWSRSSRISSCRTYCGRRCAGRRNGIHHRAGHLPAGLGRRPN